MKTQLIEYDYSKMGEESEFGNETETRPEDPLPLTEPLEPIEAYEATSTPAPTEYDEYATTTTSPELSTTATLEDEAGSITTDWWGNESMNVTTTAGVEVTTESEYTQDTPERRHLLEEPQYEDVEGDMETGWGWFGTSETTPTDATIVSSTPKPAKKKSSRRRRRKKTRRNRTKKNKNKRENLVGRHDGMECKLLMLSNQSGGVESPNNQ